MAKQYTLLVWNTVISQYEETAVSKEVYDEYRRSEWRISKNNDKHSAHETPFSALIGGDDGKVENFHEFLSDEEGPEKLIDKKGLSCQTENHRQIAHRGYGMHRTAGCPVIRAIRNCPLPPR